MEPIKIPRYIDDSPQLLFWKADEAVPFILMLCVGIMIDHLGICLVIGYFFVKLFRKFRDNNPDGYVMHLMYWCGFMPFKSRIIPNAFSRRFIS